MAAQAIDETIVEYLGKSGKKNIHTKCKHFTNVFFFTGNEEIGVKGLYVNHAVPGSVVGEGGLKDEDQLLSVRYFKKYFKKYF